MASNIHIEGITEREYPELYAIFQNLMQKFEINEIKITIKPNLNNAYVIGNKITIGKPLIEKLSRDELEGVIAHEFSHIHLLHTLSGVFLSVFFITPFVIFWITFNPKNLASVIYLIGSIFFLIYGFRVRNWITLHQEVNADILAVYHTKNPDALENALIKMELKNLTLKRPGISSIFNAISWLVAYTLGLTHPELVKRLQYLELSKRILHVPEQGAIEKRM